MANGSFVVLFSYCRLCPGILTPTKRAGGVPFYSKLRTCFSNRDKINVLGSLALQHCDTLRQVVL